MPKDVLAGHVRDFHAMACVPRMLPMPPRARASFRLMPSARDAIFARTVPTLLASFHAARECRRHDDAAIAMRRVARRAAEGKRRR